MCIAVSVCVCVLYILYVSILLYVGRFCVLCLSMFCICSMCSICEGKESLKKKFYLHQISMYKSFNIQIYITLLTKGN